MTGASSTRPALAARSRPDRRARPCYWPTGARSTAVRSPGLLGSGPPWRSPPLDALGDCRGWRGSGSPAQLACQALGGQIFVAGGAQGSRHALGVLGCLATGGVATRRPGRRAATGALLSPDAIGPASRHPESGWRKDGPVRRDPVGQAVTERGFGPVSLGAAPSGADLGATPGPLLDDRCGTLAALGHNGTVQHDPPDHDQFTRPGPCRDLGRRAPAHSWATRAHCRAAPVGERTGPGPGSSSTRTGGHRSASPAAGAPHRAEPSSSWPRSVRGRGLVRAPVGGHTTSARARRAGRGPPPRSWHPM
jgi:hypothetical protein